MELSLEARVEAVCKRCGVDVDLDELRAHAGKRSIGTWRDTDQPSRRREEVDAPGLCGCGGDRVVVTLSIGST